MGLPVGSQRSELYHHLQSTMKIFIVFCVLVAAIMAQFPSPPELHKPQQLTARHNVPVKYPYRTTTRTPSLSPHGINTPPTLCATQPDGLKRCLTTKGQCCEYLTSKYLKVCPAS